MNNVVDEILQDDPKFRIIDAEGNIIYDNISIEMITAITQIGTALNKALFDSIKTDLNSRLLTSNKATQAQAQAGTDNTNYMTALRVEQHYTNRRATQAQAEAGTDNTKYMTPLRVLQEINALALPSKQMSIKTGTITDNGIIPQTSGYSNYLYIVTPNTASNNFTANTSHSANDDYNGFRFYCSVNQETRKVTAYTQSYYFTNGSIQGWTNSTSLTADYYEIAWN